MPLRDLINKFAHVRFEPSGFTGNPEIPIAKSVIDYIFRWLGSRFLVGDDRAALGLQERGSVVGATPFAFGGALSPQPEEGPSAIDEAKEPPADDRRSTVTAATATATAATDAGTRPGRREPPTASAKVGPADRRARNGHANGHANGNGNGNGAASALAASLGAERTAFKIQEDAPSCADCGSIMVRNGSCYKCLNCGSTSGCS